MRRILSLLLVTSLVLCGCAFGTDRMKEPVTFYYLRQHTTQDDYDSFFTAGAIGQEIREAAGHSGDLNYLLALYMQGPNDSDLMLSFPSGTRITRIELDGRKLTIALSVIPTAFSEIDITVSCACLAKSCMGFADVDTVTVESYAPDERILFSRTFTKDNLILEDTSSLPPESAEST